MIFCMYMYIQIVGLNEVLHLRDIPSLETLDLRKNPLQVMNMYMYMYSIF